MLNTADPRILELQVTFERTHTGRSIRKNSLDLLRHKRQPSEEVVECSNCGFIIDQEWFLNGCPNCNSRESINNGV